MPADMVGTTYDMTYQGSERVLHVIATLDAINDDGSLTFSYLDGTMTIQLDAVLSATPTDAPVSTVD